MTADRVTIAPMRSDDSQAKGVDGGESLMPVRMRFMVAMVADGLREVKA